MYPSSVKTRARNLYIVKGMSCEAIANLLKKEYPKISSNTVRKWSEEKIKGQRTWVDEKNSVEVDVVERVHEATVSRITEIRSKTRILTEETFKRLIDKNAPGAKSWEGLVYAFKAIAGLEVQLAKEEEGAANNLSPAQVIQIILSIFQSIPSVRREIEANWKVISERMHQQLLEDKTV